MSECNTAVNAVNNAVNLEAEGRLFGRSAALPVPVAPPKVTNSKPNKSGETVWFIPSCGFKGTIREFFKNAPDKPLLSLKDVVQFYNLKKSTVYDLIYRRALRPDPIPYTKSGTPRKSPLAFPKVEFEPWVMRRLGGVIETPGEVAAPAVTPTTPPAPPNLLKTIKADLIGTPEKEPPLDTKLVKTVYYATDPKPRQIPNGQVNVLLQYPYPSGVIVTQEAK